MKKFILLGFMLVLAFAFSESQAQDRTVSGKVTSVEDGSTLPGVNVILKGSTTGTVTDLDGNYSLSVPSTGGVLVFSFIGLTTEEVEIGVRSVIDLSMSPDIKQLNEVVVVGYGTQERKDITGAVAGASAEDIKDMVTPDFAQAVQGRIAGVQVSSASGRPGQRMIMRVRGVASVGGVGSNEPLYVIDGVPISNADDSQNDAGQGQSPLANLNQADIADIQVLKDASAAAIYGSRASNGVVLITTKKGDFNQKTQINFSASYGFQSLTEEPELLNSAQYREIAREARANAGAPADPRFEEDNTVPDTDWIDLILRDQSTISNYQLSANGGSENTRFFLSAGYFQQESILSAGDFERLSARLNLDHKATDKLSFGTNLTFARSELFETAVDNSIFSPWPQALQGRPDEAPFDEEGGFAAVSVNNPVQMFEQENITDIYSVVGNIYAEYEIIEGLKFRTNLGTNTYYTEDFFYAPTTHPLGEGNTRGSGAASNSLRTNWLTENTLSYSKSLMSGDLQLDALVGFTYQVDTREFSRVEGQAFPSNSFRYLASAAQITQGTSDWTSNELESLLGRVNLDYKEKYLVSLSVRRDGSSRFGANDRYGVFPSASVGWRLSSEDFMQDLDFIQDLKVRASYGVTGNQASIGDFDHLTQISAGENYNDQPGIGTVRLGNPDLTWEETRQLNLGLDISVLNARLNFAIDYYNKLTDGLLINEPLPYESGLRSIRRNLGEVENRGFEISINSVNINTGDFRWESSFNIARNVNEVLALGSENAPIDVGFVSRTAVGQPIGAFFVVNALGVDPDTGDMVYEDIPGEDGAPPNGGIGGEDRQFLGNPWPDYIGGLTNNLSYKGFDLSFFFQYSFGGDIYRLYDEGNGGASNLGAAIDPNNLGTTPPNMTTDVLDRWQQPGDVTDVPRAVAGARGVFNTQRSSRFLEDGSYVRLKNVTLGYNLPQNVVNRAGLQSLRVYVTGQNLLTFTDYSGFDPEVSSSLDDRQLGVDQGAIPQLRSYIFGLNIGL